MPTNADPRAFPWPPAPPLAALVSVSPPRTTRNSLPDLIDWTMLQAVGPEPISCHPDDPAKARGALTFCRLDPQGDPDSRFEIDAIRSWA